ncbi:RadC family protein [Sphingomonas canadensis]|uniref:RadC family protein n=1 Tax=Sphingomonas canadensis TaxID=1219257 RepID=A0ABW3H973_9SPHN|nr:DNA repair protein RadC [Sphingomonas canadensis]MCW3837742.1 DNA repair protein RadC [Sphingomonas canadensis]
MPGAAGAADLLLERFGSLGAVLTTDRHTLAATTGDRRLAALLDCVHAIVGHVLRSDIAGRTLIADEEAVVAYLRGTCGHARNEELRVLYLDAKNQLIHERAFPGSVDEAPFHVREILRRGLDVGAASLILAHNHPSGDPAPSAADREITQRLTRAAADIGIAVLDHIIVTRTKSFSFRLGATI